jgi:hypothetical protein
MDIKEEPVCTFDADVRDFVEKYAPLSLDELQRLVLMKGLPGSQGGDRRQMLRMLFAGTADVLSVALEDALDAADTSNAEESQPADEAKFAEEVTKLREEWAELKKYRRGLYDRIVTCHWPTNEGTPCRCARPCQYHERRHLAANRKKSECGVPTLAGHPCGWQRPCPYHATDENRCCCSSLVAKPDVQCSRVRMHDSQYCEKHCDFPDFGKRLTEYSAHHRGEPADMDAFIKYAYPMTEAPAPMEQPEFTTLWLSLLQPSSVDTPRTEDYKHGARMTLELMTKPTMHLETGDDSFGATLVAAKSFGMAFGKSEVSLIAEGAASVGSGSGGNVSVPN